MRERQLMLGINRTILLIASEMSSVDAGKTESNNHVNESTDGDVKRRKVQR